MPGLQAFGRRWRTSSDGLPVLAVVLGTYHLAWFLAYIIGVNINNDGLSSDCEHAAALRGVQYGIMGLFVLAAVTEFAIVGVGLRGGPFEVSKRRAIKGLLYLEVAFWVLLLVWTILGTVAIASPHISNACWENNPCLYSGDTSACISNTGEYPTLTPACQRVWEEQKDANICWYGWYGVGVHWTPALNGSLEILNEQCPEDWRLYSEHQMITEQSMPSMEEVNRNESANAAREAEIWLLAMLGIAINESDISGSAPWFGCLDIHCHPLLREIDLCNQFDKLFALVVPESTSNKKVFEALVYSSYATLFLSGLLWYIGFTSFPDYSDVDSWEGALHSMGRFCCCGHALTAETGTGDGSGTASKEIAKGLHMLFGGIDLNPTDQLLGFYLVSEQQAMRRQSHLIRALSEAGIRGVPSLVDSSAKLSSERTNGLASSSNHTAACMQTPGSPTSPTSPASTATSPLKGSAFQQPTALGNSPFASSKGAEGNPAAGSPSAGGSGGGGGGGSAVGSPRQQQQQQEQQHGPASGSWENHRHHALHRVGELRLRPLYRHTLVRMRTMLLRRGSALGLETGTGSPRAAGQSGGGPQQPPPQQQHGQQQERQQQQPASGRGALGGQSGAAAAGRSSVLSTPATSQQREVAIKVTESFRPILVPTGLIGRLNTDKEQKELADLCLGHHDTAPKQLLLEAQSYSKFACAAYGLRSSVLWSPDDRPQPMWVGQANFLLKFVRKPLRLSHTIRQRNYRAIVKSIGAEPSDLLYVSYANVPGGYLPYMLMLDRQSKSVVLAIRGTVSMEDLVTDLLSSPIDVGGWMPDWAVKENEERGGEAMLAHLGIVGSATAILKDLEDKELLSQELFSRLTALRERKVAQRNLEVAIAARSRKRSADLATWHRQQTMLRAQTLMRGGSVDFFTQQTLRRGGSQALSAALSSIRSGGEDEGEEGEEEEGVEAGEAVAQENERDAKMPLQRAQTIIRDKLQDGGWRLVVTGHSLGAAVATLISFHLRDSFPDLKCWCFNVPGAVLSLNLSTIAQSFCTSLVVGKDVISRLSFTNCKRLVDEMVNTLARCKRPKLLLMADLLLKRFGKKAPRTFCSYAEMSDDAVHMLEGYYKASVLHLARDVADLYPPGRIIFLRPFKGSKKGEKTVWDGVWIEADALIQEGMLISPSMMKHHSMQVVRTALESILDSEGATKAVGAAQDSDGSNAV